MRRTATALGLSLMGCHPGSDVPSDLEPPPMPAWDAVCGTPGPHRVLTLEPGEHAYRVDRLPDDERVLVSTFVVDPTLPLASFPPTLDRAIHAVGPCGEAPVVVARGLSPSSRVGELLLACSDGGHGTWVIDPSGASAPRAILDGWCPPRSTAHGLLTVEAPPEQGYGTLVLLRDPADPSDEPEPLAEGIRVGRNAYFGPGSGYTTSLWANDDEAVALDEAGDAWRFDLLDGTRTLEQAGVRELRISGDGRWMAWQSLAPATGDADAPEGPVYLRDRERGSDVPLLDTHLEWTGNPWAGPYVLIRDDASGLRLWWIDGARPIELPAGTDVRGVLEDDALWLVRQTDGQTEELRWLPDSGRDPTVLAVHEGTVSRRGDGIEIFETDDVPAPDEGSLSFAPFDGRGVVRLADRVGLSRRTRADGRILTVVALDDMLHGQLRLIDPQSGAWWQLDDEAYEQSPRLDAADPFDGDVVFARGGDDHGNDDGRGVYRARPSTEPAP